MTFEPRVLRSRPARTEKLFHRDGALLRTTARVVEVQDNFVVLDRSIFYAESGGQEYDTGYIDGIAVVDVQDQGGRLLNCRGTRVAIPPIKIDTVIVHQLAAPPPFEPGQQVELGVDQARRSNLTRSHSAAHFLFHAARTMLGTAEDPLYLKGCHITESAARFDFFGVFSAEQAAEVEARANELMAQGGPIAMIPSEVSDEVFYWVWNDVVIPCGGTHVDDAASLPKLKISRSKKGAQLTRFKASYADS
jgi:alanyl-tRNA synthetase